MLLGRFHKLNSKPNPFDRSPARIHIPKPPMGVFYVENPRKTDSLNAYICVQAVAFKPLPCYPIIQRLLLIFK